MHRKMISQVKIDRHFAEASTSNTNGQFNEIMEPIIMSYDGRKPNFRYHIFINELYYHFMDSIIAFITIKDSMQDLHVWCWFYVEIFYLLFISHQVM